MKNKFFIILLTISFFIILFIFGADIIYENFMSQPSEIIGLCLLAAIFISVEGIFGDSIKNKLTNIEVAKEPKPKKYRAMMELTVINNATDKEYKIISENNFGLTWDFTNNNISNELLIINQLTEIKDLVEDSKTAGFIAKGRFYNFSVVGCVWKTFDILDEEKPHLLPLFQESIQAKDYCDLPQTTPITLLKVIEEYQSNFLHPVQFAKFLEEFILGYGKIKVLNLQQNIAANAIVEQYQIHSLPPDEFGQIVEDFVMEHINKNKV